MAQLKKWVKMPSSWVEDDGLRAFRWKAGQGADNLAALMSLAVILHHTDDAGEAVVTYDQICDAASLSRAKVANGLSILDERGLIERHASGRSSYSICNYDPTSGWAKFPALPLYRHGIITAFTDFKLRSPAELDALKLYYLFAARRDRTTNFAKISYDRIEEMTGISRTHIKRGLSTLAANALVHIEHVPRSDSEYGVASAYRLVHLDSYNHMGTTGRGMIAEEAPF